MKLSAAILAQAYTGLSLLPPFSGWRIPAAEHVNFRITKSSMVYGTYDADPHEITISRTMCLTPADLVQTMAHEMVHIALERKGAKDHADHDASFREAAQEVCAVFGWDADKF